jgi:hypothetical protein
VVIGPVPYAAGIVPRLLEFGGRVTAVKNRRRRVRKLGGAGEIRIGGRVSATTKRDKTSGKMVTYAKLRTAAQVARANRLNAQLFGPETLPAVTIEPREYMGPALQKNLDYIPQDWAGVFGR